MRFQDMYNENIAEIKPVIVQRRGKYFAGIIICIVLLYLFNNLLSLYFLSVPPGSNVIKAIMDNAYIQLTIPFLANTFVNCLWAINLALSLGIMGNFALLFYRPSWFFYLLQAFLIAVGILPLYLVHKIFPFVIDSTSMQTLVKNGLIACMVLLALIVIYLLIKSAVKFISNIRNFELL